MLNHNNINHVSLDNLPYYHDTKMSSQWHFGNMWKLEEDLKRLNKNVIGMTNAKISSTRLNHTLKVKDNETIYDAYVLDHLPNIIQFNNQEGTFFSFFSQQIHEPYIYKQNDEYIANNNPNYIINATWHVIQSLKTFLKTLRQAPYVDQNNQPMIINNQPVSVYDQSLICIVSDHGYDLSFVKNTNNIYNYLLNHHEMTKQDINVLNNFSYHLNVPIINLKNFKYNCKNQLINNQQQFNFNKDQFLSLCDVMVIIEKWLNNYYLRTNYNSFFNNRKEYNTYNNINLRKVFDDSVISDPLNIKQNSIKQHNIKRTLYWLNTYDWKPIFNSNNFQTSSVWAFNFNNYQHGIFDNQNFKKLR